MKTITVIFILAFLFNGCFKIGYVIEVGGSQEKKDDSGSGYYYKPPTYQIK